MADQKRKIGVVAATFLVAGNMMGSGVFLLPGSLAKIGTVSMWGWVVTTIGALLLAFVFAKLGASPPRRAVPTPTRVMRSAPTWASRPTPSTGSPTG